MNLRSKGSFWPIEAGLPHFYPSLKRDEVCQVAVIGAGITGALAAYHLATEGISCVVVDIRDIGGGSTSASTGLLQYEIDTPLHELITTYGTDRGVRAYQLCAEAIHKIEKLVATLGADCKFEKVPSMNFASHGRDVDAMQKEFEARRAHGFDCTFLPAEKIAGLFSFSPPAALWTEHAASINPYLFTHHLLAACAGLGTRIYDRTEVINYSPHARGVTLETGQGWNIEAERVVFATGFLTPRFLDQKVVELKSTFSLISEPVAEFTGWHRRALLWETARPYIYLRTTPEGRIIVGGEDENFTNSVARDLLIGPKTTRLLERFHQLFPGLHIEADYSWAGTFGETKDGLGYIGENPEFPRGYFALGYGGNGITYSIIAAEIIRDLYLGRPNPDAAIFRFDR